MVLAPVGLLAILLTPLVGRNIEPNRPALVRDSGSFAMFALVMLMRCHFNTDASIGNASRADVHSGRGAGRASSCR